MPQPLSNPPSPQPTARTPVVTWLGRLLLVVLVVILLAGIMQRRAISDWLELYGYTPPSAIAQLADETTMTAPARHLFYLNKPLIASKSTFAGYCKQQEQAIVLGCYHSGEHGIYLLKIANDSELHGVMQVTAAHEMLHAAYDRLPTAEKSTIDSELEHFYTNGLHDAAIKAEINAYRKSEPGQLDNEMHSIFATEVSTLPPGLETYYRHYFSDRQAVVKQAEAYQAAFRSRQAAIKRYDAELSQLKATIDQEEATLRGEASALDTQRQQLDQERQGGNVARYNAAVRAYNGQVATYNILLGQLKAHITRYNDIVKTRNQLANEEQALVKQLNGADVPAAQP